MNNVMCRRQWSEILSKNKKNRVMYFPVLISICWISCVLSECCFPCNVNTNRPFVGQNLIINCTVTDAINADDVKIIAKSKSKSFSGSELNTTLLDRRTLQGQKLDLDLQDSGWYSCCKPSCQNQKSEVDFCRIHVQELFHAPVNFSCASLNDDSLRCSWEELDRYPDESTPCWSLSYTYFKFNYHDEVEDCTSHAKATNETKVLDCKKQSGKVTCEILPRPLTLYKFYLKAAGQMYNYSVCNNESIVILTLNSLGVDAVTSTSIDLVWELATTTFYKGTTCIITYTSQWEESVIKMLHYNDSSKQEKKYILDGLHPFTEYEIQVQCSVTEGLYPGVSRTIKNRTKTSAPLIGPLMTNTSYVPCGQRCLLLYLKEPSLYFAQGILTGYLLQHDDVNISSTIQIFNNDSVIKIWSKNVMGISLQATELFIDYAEDKEFVQILAVRVHYNSSSKHYSVVCEIESENKGDNPTFIFHRCTGEFTDDNRCLGNYSFTKSKKSEMKIRSTSAEERFGVSVESPLQSRGIHWQNVGNDSVTHVKTVMNSIGSTRDDSKGFIPGVAVAAIVSVLLLLVILRIGWVKYKKSIYDLDIDVPEVNERNKEVFKKTSDNEKGSNGTQETELTSLTDTISNSKHTTDRNTCHNERELVKQTLFHENETSCSSGTDRLQEPLLQNNKIEVTLNDNIKSNRCNEEDCHQKDEPGTSVSASSQRICGRNSLSLGNKDICTDNNFETHLNCNHGVMRSESICKSNVKSDYINQEEINKDATGSKFGYNPNRCCVDKKETSSYFSVSCNGHTSIRSHHYSEIHSFATPNKLESEKRQRLSSSYSSNEDIDTDEIRKSISDYSNTVNENYSTADRFGKENEQTSFDPINRSDPETEQMSSRPTNLESLGNKQTCSGSNKRRTSNSEITDEYVTVDVPNHSCSYKQIHSGRTSSDECVYGEDLSTPDTFTGNKVINLTNSVTITDPVCTVHSTITDTDAMYMAHSTVTNIEPVQLTHSGVSNIDQMYIDYNKLMNDKQNYIRNSAKYCQQSHPVSYASVDSDDISADCSSLTDTEQIPSLTHSYGSNEDVPVTTSSAGSEDISRVPRNPSAFNEERVEQTLNTNNFDGYVTTTVLEL